MHLLNLKIPVVFIVEIKHNKEAQFLSFTSHMGQFKY